MRAKHWKRQDLIDIVETHIADEDLQGEVFGQIAYKFAIGEFKDGKFTYAQLWDIIRTEIEEAEEEAELAKDYGWE